MTTDECVVMPRLTSRPRRDQASRAISTARLKRSRALHLPPINVVVSHGPSGVLRPGSVHLGEGFPLRCIQRLSPRDIANRHCAWRHSRDTRGRFVRVLSYYGRHPSTLQRPHRIPTELRAPLRASVTISEATAPVKLPASHGPRRCKRPREIVNKTRVVFHWWLPQGQNPGIVASHLCYASHADDQWQAIVKVHGVFLS